jgi:hypothetical protein
MPEDVESGGNAESLNHRLIAAGAKNAHRGGLEETADDLD